MLDKNQDEFKKKRDKAIDILKEWEITLVKKYCASSQNVNSMEENEINSKNQFLKVKSI